MRIAALMAALVLGACVPEAPRQDVSLIWNPTVGMAATSRFDAQRFSGRWVVREGFDDAWTFEQFRFDVPAGSRVGIWDEPDARAQVRLSQLGVFLLDYVGQRRRSEEVVVLWVDEGFRTAALAARDGRAAVIVDRQPSGGADRIEAARVLLRKNGFDVSKLQIIKQ